jgi:hypothetical protein
VQLISLNRFTIVIDNLFTPEDCARYVAKVESEKEWKIAGVGAAATNTQVRVHVDFEGEFIKPIFFRR